MMSSTANPQPRHRCGVCLFELPPGTKSIKADRLIGAPGRAQLRSLRLDFAWKIVLASKSRGCPVCSRLVTFLEPKSPAKLIWSNVRQSKLEFGSEEYELIWCELPQEDGTVAAGMPPVEPLTVIESLEWGKYVPLVPLAWNPDINNASISPGNTGSGATFRQLEAWLQMCLTKHQRVCSLVIDQPGTHLYPTRLLSLQDEGQVRLVPNPGNHVRYACLSHRWGPGTRDLSLSSSTLGTYCRGVPTATLPQLFQDVVYTTRRLQIEYLWIDCLCIPQDDLQEWQKEAVNMDIIYKNSFLTIAAAFCEGSHQTLFSDLPAKFTEHRLLDDYPVYIRLKRPHVKELKSNSEKDISMVTEEPTHPLLARGWVYQEQLLSPRIVNFTEADIS
ncbi:heterokaryon incompatibility protein domain-containing protein [Trichoderma evansii]